MPITVRMAAWQVGMLINAVNAAIKSKEMNVLKSDVFERIVSDDSSFGVLLNEDKGKCGECQNNNKAARPFLLQSVSGGQLTELRILIGKRVSSRHIITNHSFF